MPRTEPGSGKREAGSGTFYSLSHSHSHSYSHPHSQFHTTLTKSLSCTSIHQNFWSSIVMPSHPFSFPFRRCHCLNFAPSPVSQRRLTPPHRIRRVSFSISSKLFEDFLKPGFNPRTVIDIDRDLRIRFHV